MNLLSFVNADLSQCADVLCGVHCVSSLVVLLMSLVYTHTHRECKHICKLFFNIICNQTPQAYTQNAPPNHASVSPKHAHQGSQQEASSPAYESQS